MIVQWLKQEIIKTDIIDIILFIEEEEEARERQGEAGRGRERQGEAGRGDT